MSDMPITVDVYHAADVSVSAGVMMGEPLSFADELVLDDIFTIRDTGRLVQLPLLAGDQGLCRADTPHCRVHLDSCLTLMAPDGGTHEALVLVEVGDMTVRAIYMMPLGDLRCGLSYRLVGVARHTATRRFAEAASGAFGRGTRITMADGTLRKVEALQPGDMILTRDAGRQPVRHIVQSTLRATGRFAPVVITAGALHNDRDLLVRSDHRLFVYQRKDHLGAGRAELLIRAGDLVDGQTVLSRAGGFIDYFQLIFDQHHIIYAEGIAAEAHLLAPHTRGTLPADWQGPNHTHRPHLDYIVDRSLIPTHRAVDLLRRASVNPG